MKILDFVFSIVARYRRHDFIADTPMPDQTPDPAVTEAPCQDTASRQTDRQACSDKLSQHTPETAGDQKSASCKTVLTALESAIKTLGGRHIAQPSGEDRQRMQSAFSNVHTYLERYDITQHPLTFMPWLILIAGRLSQLGNTRQADQGLTLIARTLHAYPDLTLAHALATQLAGLPEDLQQRTLTVLEDVLVQNSDLPQAHVDILVELTSAMRYPNCRERIDQMIQTALKQLRLEPVLSGEIRLAMIQAYSQGDGDSEMTLMA